MATLLYSIAFPNVRAASLGFRPRFACVRSPHDPIEDRLEFPSARRIDRAQMRDPPREKGAEVQAILAILRLGSGSKGGPMTEVRMKICRTGGWPSGNGCSLKSNNKNATRFSKAGRVGNAACA